MGDEGQIIISVQQWFRQGEEIFEREVGEYRALEARLNETEAELAAKWEGINQIAQALRLPLPEGAGTHRLSAVLVSEPAEPPRGARHVARAIAARLGSPVFVPMSAVGGR